MKGAADFVPFNVALDQWHFLVTAAVLERYDTFTDNCQRDPTTANFKISAAASAYDVLAVTFETVRSSKSRGHDGAANCTPR